MYECKNLGLSVANQTHIYPSDFVLKKGVFNVILGPTLAGKTTLLRLIAGLEKPTTGEVFCNGESITKLSVKKRSLSFVYQQFINYPNMTVAENIASPMRAEKKSKNIIDEEVKRIANLLQISPFLNRYPHELSGGQQQRTAIGRALAKDSDIILFDEPLVNLDYKLREELRDELPRLLKSSDRVIVYTTTEPQEALLLPGNLITLFEGKITDSGLTQDVFETPANLKTAQISSYPPLNTLSVKLENGEFVSGDFRCPPDGHFRLENGASYKLGVRPYKINPVDSDETKKEGEVIVSAKVLFTEMAGSDSFVHLNVHNENWVMHHHKPVDDQMGDIIQLSFSKQDMMIFDSNDNFVKAEV